MQEHKTSKLPYILLATFSVLLIVGSIIWYFWGGETISGTVSKIFPFGAPAADVERPVPNKEDSEGVPDGTTGGNQGDGKKLFYQLSAKPVVGAYSFTKDGQEFVRYVEKETGHIYDISPTGGTPTQVSNTTVPRIAEAFFGAGGNVVILRYLDDDTMSRREVVKTLVGYITPATDVGMLTTQFLPDNILAVSVSPNGKNLFYLLRREDGVSGNSFDFKTKLSREVFRNPLSEWAPQLLDTNRVLLTTKPSGEVAGYAYEYNIDTKSLGHLLREKEGLTTLSNKTGSRIIFGENVASNATMGAYSAKGFPLDEGVVQHESTLPFVGLPEKCAWLADGVRALCASFTTTPRNLIPDDWYRGTMSFDDVFWMVNVDSGELSFLATPEAEVGQKFDVTNPTLTPSDGYFIFNNKKDGTLWSLRVVKKEDTFETEDSPTLSPAELKDAQGSKTQ